MMTNKDKTGTLRQQRRREHERQWLKENGFNSWEALHTELMDGTIALDRVTPAHSKRTDLDKAMSQLNKALLVPKKGRQ